MQFHYLLTVTLASSVAGSAILKRDDSAVLNDISVMTSDMSVLDGEELAITPESTLFDVLKLLGPVSTVNNDILTTTRDVNAGGPFNDTESFAIAIPFISVLIPQINKTLNDLDAAHDNLQKASFDLAAPIIHTQLQILQYNSDQLANALEANLAEPFSSLVPTFKGEIDGWFVTSLADYQGW